MKHKKEKEGRRLSGRRGRRGGKTGVKQAQTHTHTHAACQAPAKRRINQSLDDLKSGRAYQTLVNCVNAGCKQLLRHFVLPFALFFA